MILKVLFSEPNIRNFNIKQVILNSLVAQNFDNAVFVFLCPPHKEKEVLSVEVSFSDSGHQRIIYLSLL